MARYIGPKCKLARREGTDLFLKSPARSIESKCKFDRKPGQSAGARRPRETVFGPHDILHWIYAVAHSPRYRRQFGASLRIDFPRIPWPSNPGQFLRLTTLGRKLSTAHLAAATVQPDVVQGEAVRLEPGFPHYDAGHIRLSPSQDLGVDVIPAVWEFRMGGYAVVQRWLKQRRRCLDVNDIRRLRQIVAAVGQTLALSDEIDRELFSG